MESVDIVHTLLVQFGTLRMCNGQASGSGHISGAGRCRRGVQYFPCLHTGIRNGRLQIVEIVGSCQGAPCGALQPGKLPRRHDSVCEGGFLYDDREFRTPRIRSKGILDRAFPRPYVCCNRSQQPISVIKNATDLKGEIR
jgi:hypothetical protein